MSGYEITCARRNKYGVIVRVGGQSWSLRLDDAIIQILTRQLRLFIQVDGQEINVSVYGSGPDLYLALEPEGFPLHNLDGLASC